jgi:hypothetical protein
VLPESSRVRQSFPSPSSVERGSSARILRVPTENRLSSPSVVLESWLVGIILRHYLEVGDLPTTVSHSFAALMLFVHLHTYSRIGVCLVVHTVLCLRINRV